MRPEDHARESIDRQLADCGWTLQDYKALNLAAAPGIAVREFPLKTGFADYLLYLNAKAAGVIEAKPEGTALIGVEPQSDKYTKGLPASVPHYALPLPFAYESTGAQTRFTNTREPDYRSRLVFTFHRPEELLRLAQAESPLRAALRHMPPLNPAGLWTVQESAIRNLERSIYNLWRQVLDYFDAFLIGLTSTPSAQTIGFFNRKVGPARQAGPAMQRCSPLRRGRVRQTRSTPYTHEKAWGASGCADSAFSYFQTAG